MTERTVIYATALLIVALALATMFGQHQAHYKNRKLQLMEGRLTSLERIIMGEHD